MEKTSISRESNRKAANRKSEDGHFEKAGKNKSRINRLRIRLTLPCSPHTRASLTGCSPVASIQHLAATMQECRQADRHDTGKSRVTMKKGYRTSQDTLGVQYFNFVVEDDAQ